MSSIWKSIVKSALKHPKNKYDPATGTYFCECCYHKPMQKAKSKKHSAYGFSGHVNYFDQNGFLDRYNHAQIQDGYDYDYESPNNSSQTHDHQNQDFQEPETYSFKPDPDPANPNPEPDPVPESEPQSGPYALWRPEREPRYGQGRSYVSGAENCDQQGNSSSEVDETKYNMDEGDTAETDQEEGWQHGDYNDVSEDAESEPESEEEYDQRYYEEKKKGKEKVVEEEEEGDTSYNYGYYSNGQYEDDTSNNHGLYGYRQDVGNASYNYGSYRQEENTGGNYEYTGNWAENRQYYDYNYNYNQWEENFSSEFNDRMKMGW